MKQASSSNNVQFQPSSNGTTRIVVVIVAYQDVTHLEKFIDAIYLPQHYIIIHLEENGSDSFRRQIEELILSKYAKYNNVVILQFGTIIYKTDSISTINLRIMNYLVNDLQLKYDYHITLGGATYPLYNDATEFMKQLTSQQPDRDVWLGELLHKGNQVDSSSGSGGNLNVLYNKRLMISSSTLVTFVQNVVQYQQTQQRATDRSNNNNNATTNTTTNTEMMMIKVQQMMMKKNMKYQKRIGFVFGRPPPSTAPVSSSQKSESSLNSNSNDIIMSWIVNDSKNIMKYKSISGNQGVYSYNTVQRLLNSTKVLQLFALSKYSCCCCVEEKLWITSGRFADHPVGEAPDALAYA